VSVPPPPEGDGNFQHVSPVSGTLIGGRVIASASAEISRFGRIRLSKIGWPLVDFSGPRRSESWRLGRDERVGLEDSVLLGCALESDSHDELQGGRVRSQSAGLLLISSSELGRSGEGKSKAVDVEMLAKSPRILEA
jgi:hypothetical protein